MVDRRARMWMLGLSLALIAAQIVDMVWPRADTRAASAASIVGAVCLLFLLGLYPNGRFTPWWTSAAATGGSLLFIASAVVGPDVAQRFLWPLPLAPFVLALVLGGQGFRYLRRSSASEREAVRWPLLGTLLLLTIVLPADAIAVFLTGENLSAAPALSAVMQVALLLPGLGFVTGLLAPPNDLVDRLLAGWVTFVIAAAILSTAFAIVIGLAGMFVPEPWPAWIGASLVVAASVAVVPIARRAGRALVFRGRAEPHRAAELLNRRLRSTLDIGDVPAEVAQAIADGTGARSVVLKRFGQQSIWAASGSLRDDDPQPWILSISHLGLPIGTVEVQPRRGESVLTGADRRIVQAVAEAAAPALHGARLASAFPELTDRERQVLAGIVRGLPNAAIAARMGVSGKTVANYVSIVLTKLRVPDKERAAELARRRAADLDSI